VDGSNNVGISTSSPSAKLHVTQSGSADALRVDDETSDTTPFIINQSGQVGINNATPDASAQLDVASTTGFLLVPRMTTTQRDAVSTPANGSILYNTTDNKLQVRENGAWVNLV